MTTPADSSRPRPRDAARDKRLAEALRANLRRRKVAAKGRAAVDAGAGADRGESFASDEAKGTAEPAGEALPVTDGSSPETPENPDESG